MLTLAGDLPFLHQCLCPLPTNPSFYSPGLTETMEVGGQSRNNDGHMGDKEGVNVSLPQVQKQPLPSTGKFCHVYSDYFTRIHLDK